MRRGHDDGRTPPPHRASTELRDSAEHARPILRIEADIAPQAPDQRHPRVTRPAGGLSGLAVDEAAKAAAMSMATAPGM